MAGTIVGLLETWDNDRRFYSIAARAAFAAGGTGTYLLTCDEYGKALQEVPAGKDFQEYVIDYSPLAAGLIIAALCFSKCR